jgi:tRNA A37 methylthiotransferase MiaB
MIGVMGCVAQLEGETLFNKISGIDFVIGTQAVGRVTSAIKSVLDHGPGFSDLGEREADYDWSVSFPQLHSPYVAFRPDHRRAAISFVPIALCHSRGEGNGACRRPI